MGTFAEKSSSPFKLRHQLSPQQLQSCQKSSKDRQKMLWIDLKTILDVRIVARSVTNSNIPNYPFFSSVLSLFTIVSFKNDACVSGTGNNGTCYSSSDCSKLGGTASGSCASGFGVCCLCKSNFKSLLYVFMKSTEYHSGPYTTIYLSTNFEQNQSHRFDAALITSCCFLWC